MADQATDDELPPGMSRGATKPSNSTDAAIASELQSSLQGGDPTGSDVQATLVNGGPDYGSFLSKNPGDEVEDFQPGSPSAPLTLPADIGSVKGSFKGGTEHGKKYAGGVFGQADRAVDAFTAQDEQRTRDEQEANRQHYGDYQKGVQGEIDATREYQDRANELAQREQEFNQLAALTEERKNNEAIAERQKYLGAYQEQIAAVKALAGQSVNPIGQLPMYAKIGLVGAEFAQGFLAARGINIDVNGQVDKFVDRQIAEHQRKISNMRESANDQLHLYEIARQNSRDDWEARQRYRGFVIAGLQSSIQANATRFQSSIAMARAQENMAKLQIEADTTGRQIADAHFNRVHMMMTTDFDRAYKQGMLGIEQQKLEIMRDKNAAKANSGALYVQDPEVRQVIGPDGKRQRVQVNPWVIDPNAPKEAQQKAYETATKASEDEGDYQDKLTRLIKARQGVEGEWGTAARLGRKVGREDEAWQEYQNAKTDFVNTVIYKRSGKQINDSEFERFFGMVPDQKLLQTGSSSKLLGQMQEVGRKEFQRTMSNPIYLKNPDTLDVQDEKGKTVTVRNPRKYSVVEDVEPGLAAEGRAAKAANEGGSTAPDQISDDLANAEREGTQDNYKPSDAWKKMMPQFKDQPVATTFVEDLVKGAVMPQHYRQSGFGSHTLPSQDTDIRAQSLEALDRLAAEQTASGQYARMWLNLIKTDPQQAAQLLK